MGENNITHTIDWLSQNLYTFHAPDRRFLLSTSISPCVIEYYTHLAVNHINRQLFRAKRVKARGWCESHVKHSASFPVVSALVAHLSIITQDLWRRSVANTQRRVLLCTYDEGSTCYAVDQMIFEWFILLAVASGTCSCAWRGQVNVYVHGLNYFTPAPKTTFSVGTSKSWNLKNIGSII